MFKNKSKTPKPFKFTTGMKNDIRKMLISKGARASVGQLVYTENEIVFTQKIAPEKKEPEYVDTPSFFRAINDTLRLGFGINPHKMEFEQHDDGKGIEILKLKIISTIPF